jgi:probable rRNA maturation factor
MAAVNFFSEEISFKLAHPRKTSNWIRNCVKKEKRRLKSLNFIFCSDANLRMRNIQYLKHRTFTDIITFDQSEDHLIEGEIYISIDRVKENASALNVEFDEELHRVIIHGVLHLIGYKDKKATEKKLMRKKEDAYLSLR